MTGVTDMTGIYNLHMNKTQICVIYIKWVEIPDISDRPHTILSIVLKRPSQMP